MSSPLDYVPEFADPDGLLTVVTDGKQLRDAVFDPPRFVVPGLVPEGLTLTVGPSKVGKSWAKLDMALAVADGGKAFGSVDCPRGRVLYLAFEDSSRRIQDRAWKLLGHTDIPAGFDHLTRLAEPGKLLDTIRAWLRRHAGEPIRYVVVDTLGKIMPPAPQGVTQYYHEVAVGTALKDLADDHHAALDVVHHQRKMPAKDFVETVSGTNGLAGTADTIMALERPRGEPDGALKVTGRDVEDQELGVRMIGGAWILTGDPPRDTSLSELSANVLACVNRNQVRTRAEDVADVLGIQRDTAKDYLGRLARSGRINRAERGFYTRVASVASVASDGDALASTDTPDATEATLATPPEGDW